MMPPLPAPLDSTGISSVLSGEEDTTMELLPMERGDQQEAMSITIRRLRAQLEQSEREKVALLGRLEDQIKVRTRELEEANHRLEEANRLCKLQAAAQLEHFACMSHEIRTPLNCVVGMSSLLLDTTLDEVQKEAVEMITTSGDLLSTVVDDVLDYSKLETGKFELDVKQINLQQTLDSVVTAIQIRCDENKRGITCRTFFGITLPKFVETDHKRLQQILYNLLGNAVKFSPDNSYVDLHCKLLPDPRNPAEKVIRYTVKDYGRGIDKSDYEKIFEPFRQATKETGTVYGGTGLGLPITSKLVQRLGGTICVNSEKGKFCEFIVDIPFLGEPVDLSSLSARLSDAMIILVVPRPASDCPVLQCFDDCGVPWAMVPSCTDMKNMALSMSTAERERFIISFVYDEAYERSTYQVFQNNTKSTLVTFGYKNHVKEAYAHIRSPCRVFPSILLPALADIVSDMRNQRLKTFDCPELMMKCKSDSDWGLQQTDKTPSAKTICNRNKESCAWDHYNVLIAEDNVINQKVLCKTLQRLGLKSIDIVDNGRKAVDATADRRYDVVFMDIEMPVMGGLDACRLIADRDGESRPLIIFVTAHAMDAFQVRAREAGGSGFISKPFHLKRIARFFKSLESTTEKMEEPNPQSACGAVILCDPQNV